MSSHSLKGPDGKFVADPTISDVQLCTGPSHDEPTWLPATEKFFYRAKTGSRRGKLTARCRLCANWSRLKNPGSNHGWVPISDAWPIVNEAVTRIGLAELVRRSGVSKSGISNIVRRQNSFVQKKTLRLITLELISAKRKNEQPHAHSRRHHMKRLNAGQPTCSGCGTTLSNYTDGCGHCWDRRRNKKRRR